MKRWVNTKVVIDIESNKVLDKQGYYYSGKWSLATNVTWTFTASSEGMILGGHSITTGTPTKDGIDINSAGYGARLQLDGLSAATPRPRFMSQGGVIGTKVLEDGTVIGAYFAPVDWTDAQEGFDNTAPQPPPVITGWGLLLGQKRNRLIN